jgi:hypothetical protein
MNDLLTVKVIAGTPGAALWNRLMPAALQRAATSGRRAQTTLAEYLRGRNIHYRGAVATFTLKIRLPPLARGL